jgi:predicted component of type VI protein secretion system
MIRLLTDWLTGRTAEPDPAELALRAAEAEVRRLSAICNDAFDAWQADKQRRDSRAEHVTFAAYQHAKHDALRAEMALRDLRSSVGGGACPPKRRGVAAGSAWRGAR